MLKILVKILAKLLALKPFSEHMVIAKASLVSNLSSKLAALLLLPVVSGVLLVESFILV